MRTAPDDLDGDGHITQMRVRDPNGRWKPHPDFPNLMIRCKDDEPGQYRMLGEEGYDNDGDGRVNEDGDGFYDPNRDWAWQWQPRYIQHGAYRYPFSVPENRAVADFVMDHANIAGAQSYHNSGGMILRGPGIRKRSCEPADVAVHDSIAKRGEQMLPSYKYLETSTGLYEVYGGEGEWLYAMQGIFTFCNELFPRFNFFRKPAEGTDGGRRFNCSTSTCSSAKGPCLGTRSTIRSSARSRSAGSKRTGSASRLRSSWRRSATGTWPSRSITRTRCRGWRFNRRPPASYPAAWSR